MYPLAFLEIITKRLINQQTDRPDQRKVALTIICYIYFRFLCAYLRFMTDEWSTVWWLVLALRNLCCQEQDQLVRELEDRAAFYCDQLR